MNNLVIPHWDDWRIHQFLQNVIYTKMERNTINTKLPHKQVLKSYAIENPRECFGIQFEPTFMIKNKSRNLNGS